MMKTETNSITGETRTRLSYVELGQKMIDAHGIDRCVKAYQTDDLEWIGRNALSYGDIQPNGTLN